MATDTSGIMAMLAGAQPAAQPSPPATAPEGEMIFSQMRQNISPKEFSDEMLASAEKQDPKAVAEFRQALEEANVSPEILDLLNSLVDEVLANPQNYQQIREKYMAQGVTEDILPEQFDPEFFAALNIAVDQMRGEPAGPQAFAKGGIAELRPIARAISSYGRNGDSMLAHITPAEARMLKSRGGSGTINPRTGLPEFFSLGSLFSKIGSAVKSFAKSTVGRIVITAALGFFLGPAAASVLGVSSAAGVAAVSGFIGSAGSTLAAGGNLRDALKAGATGALVSGVGAGVMGDGAEAFKSGSYQGPTTVSGQVDRFKDFLSPTTTPTTPATTTPTTTPTTDVGPAPAAPSAPQAAPAPTTSPVTEAKPFTADYGLTANQAPPTTSPLNTQAAANIAKGFGQSSTVPTVGESLKTIGEGFGMGEGPASLEKLTKGASDLFMPQGASQEVLNSKASELMARTPGMTFKTALEQVSKDPNLVPSALRSYGPTVAAGLGIMGLTGGFQQKPVTSPYSSLFTGGAGSAKDLMAKNPSKYYLQNLPGVQYFGGSVLPPATPFTPPPTGGGYAMGGQVQSYLAGGEALEEDLTRVTPDSSGAVSPSDTPASLPRTRITVPAASQIGTASRGTARASTPGVGRYPATPPAAQTNYYRGLNQAALSGQLPSADTQAGIRQAYQELLGRSPDMGGMMFYSDPRSNFSMDAIRKSIESSPERRGYLNQSAPTTAGIPTPARQGIAALSGGGYPRRTGQIDGPGTETSDSIPAMLSDGEFVLTARAVRGAGNGNRRAGAKKLYALMHRLERNASRG